MEKNIISETLIKNTLDKILAEELSRVNRYDFGKVQFKIDELQNSLSETIKELRKLEDSIPRGLENLTNSRINNISESLNSAQKNIMELKEKVKHYKKKLYSPKIEEKKS